MAVVGRSAGDAGDLHGQSRGSVRLGAADRGWIAAAHAGRARRERQLARRAPLHHSPRPAPTSRQNRARRWSRRHPRGSCSQEGLRMAPHPDGEQPLLDYRSPSDVLDGAKRTRDCRDAVGVRTRLALAAGAANSVSMCCRC